MFYEEIREKKKIGNGIFSKTGSRGYVGKMKFPMDLLKGKEKREYKKGGKIVLSNLYDTILLKSDFLQLEPHEQKNRLQYWRLNFKVKEIQQQMKISSQDFYKLIYDLELPVNQAKKRKEKKRTGVKVDKLVKPIQSPAIIQEPETEILDRGKTGFQFTMNGHYFSEELKLLLNKINILIDGELNSFQVEIMIKESRK